MHYFVYLLLSLKDHRTYLGSTDNLNRRLNEHHSGKCKATKYRSPLKLIYTEKFETLIEARKREKFLKTKNGRKELRIIFSGLKIAR